ncbi:hypothetical protein WJ96_20860 [Burkholderia ubonensis]|uniref:Uncharacterized protein n=1 Tax=Burkholderia ubonensis TaxID=101571 RepID=A0AAW3MMW1_9BURK|nr:hypothetical protein WJ96_20860 [Burkholderia ubonensis]
MSRVIRKTLVVQIQADQWTEFGDAFWADQLESFIHRVDDALQSFTVQIDVSQPPVEYELSLVASAFIGVILQHHQKFVRFCR